MKRSTSGTAQRHLLTVRRMCDSFTMRPLSLILAFLMAGCGSVTVRETGISPVVGSIATIHIARGSTGAMPPDVADAIERAMRLRLDNRGLTAGSDARATWRVIRSEEGSRAGSALTLGIGGSASVTIGVRLTTAGGHLIQEFETTGSDNSMGPRFTNAGSFAGRAAGHQIAHVLGR